MIAIDRVQEKMRLVSFALNQNVPFVGQFQINNWIAYWIQCSQIDAMLHRMYIARAIQ
jgi:hypothetical protein